MIFTQKANFYKLNDDSTITVKVGDKYYRCKARFDILLKFNDKTQGEEFDGKYGLAYMRGQGLVLQLVEVL